MTSMVPGRGGGQKCLESWLRPGPHDFCHDKPQRVPPTACRAHAHRPSTDNRGMRVLVDTGVLLCGCLLLALIVGQTGTATVIWLIVAVTIAGLSMSTDQR